MKKEIRYIELKTGYSDNGPAWIGLVQLSSSGNTIYFNDKAFRKRQGTSGNYYDVETYEEYWISGVKKNSSDRHWAGFGKILIGKNVINDYLKLIGKDELSKTHYEIIDIPEIYPIERIYGLENSNSLNIIGNVK